VLIYKLTLERYGCEDGRRRKAHADVAEQSTCMQYIINIHVNIQSDIEDVCVELADAEKRMLMRLKIEYSLNGSPVSDIAQVENFPAGV